jgi:hypothetical protein
MTREDCVHDLSIDERVRRCYESALETGLGEKAAIDAAFVLWRAARPAEAIDTARHAVARIIALSRVERATGRPIEEVLMDHELDTAP